MFWPNSWKGTLPRERRLHIGIASRNDSYTWKEVDHICVISSHDNNIVGDIFADIFTKQMRADKLYRVLETSCLPHQWSLITAPRVVTSCKSYLSSAEWQLDSTPLIAAGRFCWEWLGDDFQLFLCINKPTLSRKYGENVFAFSFVNYDMVSPGYLASINGPCRVCDLTGYGPVGAIRRYWIITTKQFFPKKLGRGFEPLS